MQITLPDDPALAARAAEAGFTRVEDYVRDLIDRHAADGPDTATAAGDEPEPRRMSREEWKRRFDRFMDNLEPIEPGVRVDDSRESIYPVRD